MKRIQIAAMTGLITVLLLMGCSGDRPTNAESQPTAVAITLLKTSLAATVQTVTLEVVQNDQIIHRDTAAVVDGDFSFPTFDLNAGVTLFTVNALNSLNRVIYSGHTTATIEPSRNNTVVLLLLPAVPMVKLSPYWRDTQTGSSFRSQLELYNIARFRNGVFEIAFNREIVRFDSVRSSSGSWGDLEAMTTMPGPNLFLSIGRQSDDDSVPANSPALVDIWFTALGQGTTSLTPSVNSMVDDDGPVAELSDDSFVADGQTVNITQVAGYGTMVGSVTNAFTEEALDGVNITVTGPTQRSVTTNDDGVFSVAELPYGSYQVTASKTGFTQGIRTVLLQESTVAVNFGLTPLPDSNQYRVILTWDAEPHDLDLHLWTLQTEIYFGHQGSLDMTPYAFLDVDDLDGYGPETITIEPLMDTCKFYVHNYTGSPDITVSRAHIDYYKGTSLVRSFDVPTTGSGLWWYVFDLTSTGSIIERNVILDYNPGTGAEYSPPAKRAAK